MSSAEVVPAAVIPAPAPAVTLTIASTTAEGTAAHAGTPPGAVATPAPGPSIPAPARKHRRPRLHLLRYEPAAEEPTGPLPPARVSTRPEDVVTDVTGSSDIAALRGRAEQVLRLILEVLDGRRPAAQLTAHLDPRVLRYVRAALAQRPPGSRPSRMTSLHIDRPCAVAMEVAAVYRRGPRARALAARFEPVPPATAAVRGHARGEPDARTGDPRVWRCVTLRLL